MNPSRVRLVRSEENHTGISGAFRRAENATVQPEESQELSLAITIMFDTSKYEHFENGFESELARTIIALVTQHGNAAVIEIAYHIISNQVNAEVASEALRCLGDMTHSSSYDSRLWLLEYSLQNSSAMVRDGAILGLASLGDCHAMKYIQQAIQRELYKDLCDKMVQVFAYLESLH
jgi:hypothetical protein